MAGIKWVLASDIDGTLIGCGGEAELAAFLHARPEIGVIYLTGRTRANAETMLKRHGFPEPLALATDIGADVYWGPDLRVDESWAFQQRRDWSPRRVMRTLDEVSGVEYLGRSSHWRLAYRVDSYQALGEARTRLVRAGVMHRTLWNDEERRLDIVPRGAFKGRALKYILGRLNLRAQQCFVAGDAENDVDLMEGRYRGVLVANGTLEIKESLPPVIVRARYEGALGVLEGLRQFLDEPLMPEESENAG
ncbi:HAD family hydrolase [Sulfobacillus harzensis]|uniref:HAD hydrolase family protein n=1 Tax=Sulfobacillus harzensis TaxID=2729629 RepID=A0A7Y0L5P7_9FIRM|nr:HAD family hydrolase [Sulfobacillus harzensis]NMP22965.1 HAD hydrolase family protein [Sulfobacillus harzensis]